MERQHDGEEEVRVHRRALAVEEERAYGPHEESREGRSLEAEEGPDRLRPHDHGPQIERDAHEAADERDRHGTGDREPLEPDEVEHGAWEVARVDEEARVPEVPRVERVVREHVIDDEGDLVAAEIGQPRRDVMERGAGERSEDERRGGTLQGRNEPPTRGRRLPEGRLDEPRRGRPEARALEGDEPPISHRPCPFDHEGGERPIEDPPDDRRRAREQHGRGEAQEAGREDRERMSQQKALLAPEPTHGEVHDRQRERHGAEPEKTLLDARIERVLREGTYGHGAERRDDSEPPPGSAVGGGPGDQSSPFTANIATFKPALARRGRSVTFARFTQPQM